jgi:hypothetical protein
MLILGRKERGEGKKGRPVTRESEACLARINDRPLEPLGLKKAPTRIHLDAPKLNGTKGRNGLLLADRADEIVEVENPGGD